MSTKISFAKIWLRVFLLVILLPTTSCSSSKKDNFHSQILLVDITVNTRITRLFDLTAGKSKQVSIEEADLLPVGWSPSGKLLLFDGISMSKIGQIWMSDASGERLLKIFDARDYPSVTKYFIYDPSTNSSHKSYWLKDSLIFINAGAKTILFDVERREIKGVIDGLVVSVSSNGEFWIEQESTGNPSATLVFLSGERFSIPRNAYHPSPDGKMVLYVQEQNGNRLLYVANVNKQKGLFGEKAVAMLPSAASFPIWSPSSEYLLYPIPNNNENEPPFYGKCIVISATDGQEIYNERCDYGGGFLAWSPDENSNEFGVLSYNKEFIVYNIETKKIRTIFSSDLQPNSTRWLVDWKLIAVP